MTETPTDPFEKFHTQGCAGNFLTIDGYAQRCNCGLDAARAADAARHQQKIDRWKALGENLRIEAERIDARRRALGMPDAEDRQGYTGNPTAEAVIEWLAARLSTLEAENARLKAQVSSLQEELAYKSRWADCLAVYLDENHDAHGSDMAWDTFVQQEHLTPPMLGCACQRCREARGES